MRDHLILASLLSLLCFGAATTAGADTVFSNLSPAGGACAPCYFFDTGEHSPEAPYFRAMPFTVPVTNSFSLDQITLPVFNAMNGSQPMLIVSINSDRNGLPGEELERFTFSGFDGSRMDQPAMLQGASATHPVLAAGQQYWLTTAVSSPTTMRVGWPFNDQGSTGRPAWQAGRAPWVLMDLQTLAAFRVTGTPVATAAPLTRLRFAFRDARQRAAGLRAPTDIISFARRKPDERFLAPVRAAIDGHDFPNIDLSDDGVLTVAGSPAGVALDEWLPVGGTMRVSFTNGNGDRFAVTLRRSANAIAVLAPQISAVSSDTVLPSSMLSFAGSGFSPVAAENDVLMTLPDGRSFHLSPKRSSATALDLIVPLVVTSDRSGFYAGSFELSVSTAPGYPSNRHAFRLADLPQLTTPPGTVLTQAAHAVMDLVDATIPVAGAAMSSNGTAPADIQSVQTLPHAAMTLLADLADAARSGTPKSFDVNTPEGVRRVYVDAAALQLMERLLAASGAVDRTRTATALLLRTLATESVSCAPTPQEAHILAAQQAWQSVDIASDIIRAVKGVLLIGGTLEFLSGGSATATIASLLPILTTHDLLETAGHILAGYDYIQLRSLDIQLDIRLKAGVATPIVVSGIFISPLIGATIRDAIVDIVTTAIVASGIQIGR